MRQKGIIRFVLLGAAGFGVGGAIAGVPMLLSGLIRSMGMLLLMLVLAGAIGGASLGLALKDGRKTIALALLGGLGFTFGISVAFMLAFMGFLVPQSEVGSLVAMVLLAGAIGGASLGLALWDWKRIIVLTLAGAAGFGAGAIAGYSLQGIIPGGSYLLENSAETMIGFAVTGIITGASLGATLGYLEWTTQRPRSQTLLRIAALTSLPLIGGLLFAGFVLPGRSICGEEERTALSEFPQYGGIEKEPGSSSESGGCSLGYETSAPPEEVAAYSAEQLKEHGWKVEHQLEAKGDGSDQFEGTLVTAYRDGLRYDAVYESLEFYNPPRPGTLVAVAVFEDRRKKLSRSPATKLWRKRSREAQT